MCYTLCGGAEYRAPEMVAGTGYDRTVDYWALGVVCCELLTGSNPFTAPTAAAAAAAAGVPSRPSELEIYRRIAEFEEGSLVFPRHLSEEAVDAVTGLLQPDPVQRLGFEGEARHHEWFCDVDWHLLQQHRLKPPAMSLPPNLPSLDARSLPHPPTFTGDTDVFTDF